jgi:hypothetical protein
MATIAEARRVNEAFYEKLTTPGLEKQAADAVNDFTRTKIRENGFYRRIIPMVPISNDELDRRVDTPKPYKVIDKEPDSPAAVSFGFGGLPTGVYIRGPRWACGFDRIVSPRHAVDVEELRTWHMDIRQVLSDNSVKDVEYEEDRKFLAAVNTALVGQDQTVPWSGTVQWELIEGGIDRDTLYDMKKIMPRTDSHLEPKIALTNNITINEVMKGGRDEFGGDMAQDVFRKGWTETEFLGMTWIITIKTALVPEDTVFLFAAPDFIGKSFETEPLTMYIKREAYMLDFFLYETIGGGIGHTGGLARADFG